MKIYRVETRIDDYQYLEQDGIMPQKPDEFNAFLNESWILCECQPAAAAFKPPLMYSPRPKMPRPDFWKYSLFHTFALPQESVDKARRFLGNSGELLPFAYKSEVFSAFNVLQCVDYEVFPEKTPGRLLEEAAAGSIPLGLFRAKERVYLYAFEVTGDSDTEFKAFVESEQMTGLRFREVWNSEKQNA